MAIRIATFWPVARIDLFESASYIDKQNPAAAIRFLLAAEKCCNELAISPDLGVSAEFESVHAADVRRWRIKGFEKYLIFYRPTPNGVEILRILHGARDIEVLFDPPDES